MFTEYIVFDIRSFNDDLIKEFHQFFSNYGLDNLFLDENRASSIHTSDNDVRSLVKTGSTAEPFMELASFILTNTDNKRYESALFRIIDEPGSYRKLVTYVKRTVSLWQSSDDKAKKNFWNIVYYDGTSITSPAQIFY